MYIYIYIYICRERERERDITVICSYLIDNSKTQQPWEVHFRVLPGHGIPLAAGDSGPDVARRVAQMQAGDIKYGLMRSRNY